MRAYEAGDPLNRVHWRATARTGQLHSKVYEPSTVVGATIVLDFHRDSYLAEARALPLRAGRDHRRLAGQRRLRDGPAGGAGDQRPRRRGPHPAGRLGPRARAAAQAARQTAAMLDQSDRLQPLVVPTRRGPEQLLRILETLARVELTDGLRFHELIERSGQPVCPATPR